MQSDKVPDILHKIMPAEYGGETLPFLSNGLIRFTQPGAMNDPLETRSFVDSTTIEEFTLYLDNFLQSDLSKVWNFVRPCREAKRMELPIHAARYEMLKDFKENREMFLKEQWDAIYRNRDDTCGILSLTENVTSSAMWSHYASRHTGVAFGFDAKKIRQLSGRQRGFSDLRSVEYSDELSPLSMALGTKALPHNHFFRKSRDWRYEKEWRILVEFNEPLNGRVQTKLDRKDSNGHQIILIYLGHELIKEIRIGLLASRETEKRVLEYRDRAGRPIRIFKMKASSSRFGLEAVPL